MGNCTQCINKIVKVNKEVEQPENELYATPLVKENEDILKIVPKSEKQTTNVFTAIMTEEPEQFEIRLLNEINSLRTNPYEYITKLNKIKDNCIIQDNKYIYNTKDGHKLTIKQGKGTIDKCISFLKKVKPLKALKLNVDIKISLDNDMINNANTNEEEILYFLRNKREELKKKCGKVFISLDYFDDPELIVFLDLIEAEFKGYKREILLNPDISSFNASFVKIPNRIFTVISSFM